MTVKTAALATVVATMAAPSVFGYSAQQGQPKTETRTETRIETRTGDEPPARRARELLVIGGPSSQIGVSIKEADTGEGIIVSDVKNNGPAARAGVRTGDVIVEFDGERVRSTRQFSRLVQETAVGHTVKATVLREGHRTDVQITPDRLTVDSLIDHDMMTREVERARGAAGDLRLDIEERMLPRLREFQKVPEMPDMADMPGRMADAMTMRMSTMNRPRLGVSLEAVSGQLAGYFGVKSGVLVQSVTEKSAAEKGGMKAGDVITTVVNEPVKTYEDLSGALSHVKDGESVSITVMRDRKETKLTVTPGPAGK